MSVLMVMDTGPSGSRNISRSLITPISPVTAADFWYAQHPHLSEYQLKIAAALRVYKHSHVTITTLEIMNTNRPGRFHGPTQ